MSTKRKPGGKRKVAGEVHVCGMAELSDMVSARDTRIDVLSRENETYRREFQAAMHQAAARENHLVAENARLSRHVSALAEAVVLVVEAGRGRRL